MFQWFKRLISRYSDYHECGAWASIDIETGKCLSQGKMYSRTIKVEREDGSIGIDSEWITDETVEQEKQGGPQSGPADPPDPPDDPTLKADWWKK